MLLRGLKPIYVEWCTRTKIGLRQCMLLTRQETIEGDVEGKWYDGFSHGVLLVRRGLDLWRHVIGPLFHWQRQVMWFKCLMGMRIKILSPQWMSTTIMPQSCLLCFAAESSSQFKFCFSQYCILCDLNSADAPVCIKQAKAGDEQKTMAVCTELSAAEYKKMTYGHVSRQDDNSNLSSKSDSKHWCDSRICSKWGVTVMFLQKHAPWHSFFPIIL